MKTALKVAFWYWIGGTILLGASVGHHLVKCPNDKEPPMSEYVSGLIALPGLIGYMMFGPQPPGKCDVN